MRIIKRLGYYFRFLKSILQMNLRLLRGMWRLTRLPQPAVTICGGSAVMPDSHYAKQARELAKSLGLAGFSIITGGGPGIMEAANAGAIDYLQACNIATPGRCRPLVSAGIGLLELKRERGLNPYVQASIKVDHFFSRKWLMVRYAVGFVFFPGGFGTLDELFEVITLAQVNKMKPHPIILMDSAYWQPMVNWAGEKMLKEGLIETKDLQHFVVLDDIGKAVEILKAYCSEHCIPYEE